VSSTGAGSECNCYLWTATAGSSQTGQTIAMTTTGPAGNHRGLAVWVCTSVTSVANATTNFTESAFTFTPTAGSIVIYGMADWTPVAGDQTITTATGTPTERFDSDGANYSVWGGDWVGVTATSQSFGTTTYASMKVAHAVIEVKA
jgi:hypothetical protein